eukprot:1196032-Prorocentrum_minimum.AAC.4
MLDGAAGVTLSSRWSQRNAAVVLRYERSGRFQVVPYRRPLPLPQLPKLPRSLCLPLALSHATAVSTRLPAVAQHAATATVPLDSQQDNSQAGEIPGTRAAGFPFKAAMELAGNDKDFDEFH